MKTPRAVVAALALGAALQIGYLHLQLWDARMLWRHQAGLTRYLGAVLEQECAPRAAFEESADALGWPRRVSEFADYDPATDTFIAESQRPDALLVEVQPPPPFTPEPGSFILFGEDGCFEWATYPPAP